MGMLGLCNGAVLVWWVVLMVCVAACCNVLYSVVVCRVCCGVPMCVALSLQCVVACCSVLPCIALGGSMWSIV